MPKQPVEPSITDTRLGEVARQAAEGIRKGATWDAKGGRNKERGGGILNMEDYGVLPVEAFEISEDFLRRTNRAAGAGHFGFQRSAKRSIMLGLGIAPGAEESGGAASGGQDTLNPYSKMDDTSCILTIMAVIIGVGTFSLSAAVAKMGWIQGLIALLGLSCLMSLTAHLITLLPQLLECNFETFTGLGRACLAGWLGEAFVVCSISCWWMACAFNLSTLLKNLEALADYWQPGDGQQLSLTAKFLCTLPALSFLTRTRVNQLHKVCKYSLFAMLAVAAVEITCAFCHCTWRLIWSKEGHVQIYAWRQPNTPEEAGKVGLLPGLSGMHLAFAGVGFLPYAIAEMLQPQNALKVVRQATIGIATFYVCVGMICYFGWGEDILHKRPVKKMVEIGPPYSEMAVLISVLFMVKAACSYPVYFWPLLREMEAVIRRHELPAVELKLPWALKWQQRGKVAIKVTLALLTLGPLLVKQKAFEEFFGDIFMCLVIVVHIIAPAAFIVKGVVNHWRRLRERESVAAAAATAGTKVADAVPGAAAGAAVAGAAAAAPAEAAAAPATGEAPAALLRQRSGMMRDGVDPVLGLQARVTYLGGSFCTHVAASVVVVAASAYITVVFFWLKAVGLFATFGGNKAAVASTTARPAEEASAAAAAAAAAVTADVSAAVAAAAAAAAAPAGLLG